LSRRGRERPGPRGWGLQASQRQPRARPAAALAALAHAPGNQL